MNFLLHIHKTLAMAAIAAACFTTYVFAEPDFWFIQLTDTHWGKDDNLARTKKVVAAMNDIPVKIAFAVHTGDIVDKSVENRQAVMDSGLTLLKTLKFPVYFVAGNNDIPEKHFKSASEEFIKKFGGLNRIFVTTEASVITLFDFTVEKKDGKVKYDPVFELDSLLKFTQGNKPVFVFQHFPVTDDYYDDVFHDNWKSEIKDRFVSLCASHNVAAVICGHYHRDELHWIGTIPEFVAPPIAAKMGRQASFRLYHYENGRLAYYSQYIK
jgi:predicted phosphodiesterase